MTRIFRFGSPWQLAAGEVGCGIGLVVAIWAGAQSGLNTWGKIAIIALVGGPVVFLGIRFLLWGLQIRGEKAIIRDFVRTRTVKVSEIREITLEPKETEYIGGPRTRWIPCFHLTDGRRIWLETLNDPADKPPPRMVATIDEIRALLGIHRPEQSRDQ